METKQQRIYGEEWMEQTADGVKLLISECQSCGSNWFPKKEICPDCFSEDYREKQLEGVGEVYSYTTLTVTSKEFQAPLKIAYIDYPGNVRVCGQIEDEEVAIGDKVEIVLGKIATDSSGTDVFSYKFKVAK